MSFSLAQWMDVSDAIILSEPEISAEANHWEAALMFKLPTMLGSLNVNDKSAREIYLKADAAEWM